MGSTGSREQFETRIRQSSIFSAFRPHQSEEPVTELTLTIRNHVNLKKKSLKLVNDANNPSIYTVAFDFDTSKPCTIAVYFGAREDPLSMPPHTLLQATPLQHQPASFKSEVGQSYDQRVHGGQLDVSDFKEEDLLRLHDKAEGPFAIVVHMETALEEGEDASKFETQSQRTYAMLVEKDGQYVPKILCQKICSAGVVYEMQDVFGIDDQSASSSDNSVSSLDECWNSECVICMTNKRDTTVIPCRHMCLCGECAQSLRTQTNKCPICRQQIESLLQIRPTCTNAEEPVTEITDVEDPAFAMEAKV